MFAYRLMVVFAIMGALTGAVQGTMVYADIDWFGGQAYPEFQGEELSTNDEIKAQMADMKAMGDDVGLIDTTIKELGIMGVFVNSLYRIFFIYDLIADTFKVVNPADPTENLFAPWAFVIQVGIWLTYGIGLVQVWRQTNLNSGAY